MSTTEAEYMAATKANKEIIWMKEFIRELVIRQEEFQLYYNNQSAIHPTKNATYHSRTKHVQQRYHWLQEIHMNDNESDMLTKVLSVEKLNACQQRVRLMKYPMSE